MKYSRAARVTVPTALVLLDVAGRLALPAALLALAHGLADAAVVASLTSAVAAGGRSLLLGWWTERAIVSTWRRVVLAARGQPPAALRIRGQGEAAALVTAVREAAVYEAQAVPRIVALGVALGAVALAVAVILGPAWLAFGGLAALLLGGLAALGRKRLRRAYERAWEEFGDAARDTGVLIEASAELRAHGREETFAAALLERVDRMARQERFATAWQVVGGLLPAGLAVAAVAGPMRAGGGWAAATLGSARQLADVGILGGAALVTAFALVSAGEGALRAGPLRRTLEVFMAEATAAVPAPRGGRVTPSRSLALAVIAFEGVSCTHPGAPHATPAGVSHPWADARGLALAGPNGAGKTTLVLALLGLLAPTAGRITVDGVPLDELDLADYRRRVAYLPQGAFIAPGESVAWHLRLYSDPSTPDDRLDAVLAEVGLLDVLGQHAARARIAPRDVPAGELSGGERQRMLLARVLLHDAELVVMDEPEVALDQAGRDLVRTLLIHLATDRRVLVIAHDASIVPSSFERLACSRGVDG
jgi:ABC-type multidrug transport system fused ATPase/permease subunit